MAGDWIVFEQATLDKPEVFAIADTLGVSEGDALIGLLRVWVWADQHTTNGDAPNVTKKRVDAIARFPGFAEAMAKAGWLVIKKGGVELPNFTRLNAQTAKTRALTRHRNSVYRQRQRDDTPVTEATLQNRTEQNSTEEKNNRKKEVVTSVAWTPEGNWEGITAEDREQWSEAYPACDLDNQLAQMTAWLSANPSKAQKKQWRRFIVNWLSRSKGPDVDTRSAEEKRLDPYNDPQDKLARQREAARKLREAAT